MSEGWRLRSAIAVFPLFLGFAGGGCVQNPIPVTWEASGVQVAQLDLPLGGGGPAFTASEYVLEGRELAARDGRQFRDRALLVTDFRGREGHVFG